MIALLEIAYAAVNELGGAAGGPLAEVALLEQEDVVPAGRRVEGHPDARRPAPDHDHVPGLAMRKRPVHHLRAIHMHDPCRAF
jgi:hypothetical protein